MSWAWALSIDSRPPVKVRPKGRDLDCQQRRPHTQVFPVLGPVRDDEAAVPGNDPLAALREALRLSPDNIPLRQHLAESLLGSGQPEQAEAEFKAALALAPDNAGLKLG